MSSEIGSLLPTDPHSILASVAPPVTPALQRRIAAAGKLIPWMASPEERLDLLIATVWPRDERLVSPWPEPTEEQREWA